MHPAVLQDRSGECPVCGMDLVRWQGAAAGADGTTSPAAPTTAGGVTSGQYWCPMHPEVTSDDTEAHCPNCGGMKLLPRQPAAATAAAVSALVVLGSAAYLRERPAARRLAWPGPAAAERAA